ncbi:elongation factor P 5-aminopentanone reductase [Fonticella tunisiensis]|uniref:3-oxoacyl-[acyl-carrier protein] reductase n=1 Tax=Fonticella tunisiensis TaxID=1096341 RepID=A0A4R7KPS5_9CLOT|nr:3-oxoacyl-ACP reductase FabG [Fonticella tunisiensis]TDT57249.1 3-oxoacyl-[acyl-carrier protein] reductase [Fonticella tunisiensis]
MYKYPENIIVTGASRGIGRAIAEAFARRGCSVLINYNQSVESAITLYEKLSSENLSVRLFRADVSRRDEVKSMVDYCIREFGGVDVLVNNAGIAESKLFIDITEEEWDDMMDVNLKGIFNCTQEVLKHMISEKRGKIINISSIWGIVGASCEVHYSAAKAGVIGLTKALAKELGPSNIQVNCIAPGIIKTDMLSPYSEEELEELRQETPLMRLGTAEDIAACALFLASREADFITGQVISPNGGYVI